MNGAALYHCSNGVQRRDAKQVLDEFGHLIQWRDDGQDSLLDIGCGSGDVMIDYILPLMPLKFHRLVGADLSDDMVCYARQNYQNSKVSFQKIDIGNAMHSKNIKPFEHITSFYCLHWVQNQRMAVRNIYDLLQPNGDCLVAFLANHPIFEIYNLLSQNDKWTDYMTDWKRFISPYHYSEDPVKDCEEMLYRAGFKDFRVCLKNKKFYYRDKDALQKAVKAVNPFLSRIPAHCHDDYLEDYVDYASKLLWKDMEYEQDGINYVFSYNLIVFYARK